MNHVESFKGSTGQCVNATKLTIEDFIKDAQSAVEYLQTRKEINGHVSVIGHSQGTTFAPIVSAVSNSSLMLTKENQRESSTSSHGRRHWHR